MGAPLFAMIMVKASRGKKKKHALAVELKKAVPSSASGMRLSILVPAHNEEAVIEATLQTLCENIESVNQEIQNCEIVVGLDHCSDSTETIVSQYKSRNLTVWKNEGPAGKWHVLKALALRSQADWIGFVDSGSIWESGLLKAAIAEISADPSVACVAPSYSAQRKQSLEGSSWKLEQVLKQWEDEAGGPTSVHGATVFYRRDVLVRAFEFLGPQLWLNDDVVLPLVVRVQNPMCRISYLRNPQANAWVFDAGLRSEASVEYRRRRRMVLGNLQWIRSVFFPQFFKNPEATLIASRRVARLFWAYWIGLLMTGVMGLVGNIGVSLLGLLIVVGFCLGSNWGRRLFMAFLSGLQVPLYWMRWAHYRGVSWG